MGVAVASSVSPFFCNTALDPSELRYALAALVGRSPTDLIAAETGVLPSGDTAFTPTSNGTSGAPQVSVNRGFAVVQNTGGSYIGTWPAATNVTLTVPASNPRIDILCARVRDTDVDGSGVKVFEVLTVDGVPAASPTAPAVPAGHLPLYDVRVASSSQGGGLTITDRRRYTRAAGGVRYCPASELARAGSYPSDLRVQPNGQIDVWVGTAWFTVGTPAVWSQFTPQLSSPGGDIPMGTGGQALALGRYLVSGKVCHLRYVFQAGTTGFQGRWGDVWCYLPPGLTSAPTAETHIFAKLSVAWPIGTPNGAWTGSCYIPPNSNRMNLFFPTAPGDCRIREYRVSGDSQGLAGSGIPQIPGGYPAPGILVITGTIETS